MAVGGRPDLVRCSERSVNCCVKTQTGASDKIIGFNFPFICSYWRLECFSSDSATKGHINTQFQMLSEYPSTLPCNSGTADALQEYRMQGVILVLF